MSVKPIEIPLAEIEADRIDELLFLQSALYYFFKGYEDDEIFYQEKYCNHAKD